MRGPRRIAQKVRRTDYGVAAQAALKSENVEVRKTLSRRLAGGFGRR